MKQIYKFIETPRVINEGGYKRGRYILWLNLGITEIKSSQESNGERWESMTDRLVVDTWSLDSLLKVVDPSHLVYATSKEIQDILSTFGVSEDIESWKAIRKIQIQGYDKSDFVNNFAIGGDSMWFDKATRVGLVNSLNIEKSAGRNLTNLWCDTIRIEIGVDYAISILSKLELYAIECYNVTASHLAAIEEADSIDLLRNFDISADYPEILRFPPLV